MTVRLDDPRSTCPALPGLVLTDRPLKIMLVAGLAVRLILAFILDGHMSYRGDEGIYTKLGATFFSNGFDTGPFVRPPLYFMFLAVTRAVSGSESWILVTKLLQCVAGTAVAIPVYRSALRIAGTRAARFAAGFVLFDPTLVAYTHLLWPETIFLLVVAIVFDGVADIETDTTWRSIGFGVLTGIAMLLKPVFGLFTPLLAAHWLSRFGPSKTLKLCITFGGAAALVISPWVIRNLVQYGPSIVMENQGPYNLWSGNSSERPNSILKAWVALGDPITRSEVATQRGIEAITQDPVRFARNTAIRALNLWGLEYFVVRHLVIGGYPEVSKTAFLIWFWVIQIGWVVVWVAAAAGVGPILRDPTLRLVVAYSAVLTVIVSAMVATTRFRVPLAFWIAIAAGIGLDRLFALRIGRRTMALMGAALIVLGLSASRPMFRKIVSADFQTLQDLVTENWSYFRY